MRLWQGSRSESDPEVRRSKLPDEIYARPDKDRIGAFAEFISMNEDALAIKLQALTLLAALILIN